MALSTPTRTFALNRLPVDFLFSKYSGCGNDFILIDDRKEAFPLTPHLTKSICHRQKGIGADGVILLQQSLEADFRMRIFNADGSEAEMCGNGIRCLAKFIEELGLHALAFTVQSQHRIHRIALSQEGVSVEMGAPEDIQWDIKVPLPIGALNVHRLNTGVPHVVEFVEDLEAVDLSARGSFVRHHPLFSPQGTNYNAAKLMGGFVSMRTFERGVEAETLACGTGATAVALAAAQVYGLKSPVHVHTSAGDVLKVHFDGTSQLPIGIWLSGSAHKVYEAAANLAAFSMHNCF